MRKIIQIAIAENENAAAQVALCDDGSVWNYVWEKPIYEEIPATPEGPYTGLKRVVVSPAHWTRMADIPQDETPLKDISEARTQS